MVASLIDMYSTHEFQKKSHKSCTLIENGWYSKRAVIVDEHLPIFHIDPNSKSDQSKAPNSVYHHFSVSETERFGRTTRYQSFVVSSYRWCFAHILYSFVINNARNSWKWKGRNVINSCVCISVLYALLYNWNASVKHSRNMVIKRVKTERKKGRNDCYTWLPPPLYQLQFAVNEKKMVLHIMN